MAESCSLSGKKTKKKPTSMLVKLLNPPQNFRDKQKLLSLLSHPKHRLEDTFCCELISSQVRFRLFVPAAVCMSKDPH